MLWGPNSIVLLLGVLRGYKRWITLRLYCPYVQVSVTSSQSSWCEKLYTRTEIINTKQQNKQTKRDRKPKEANGGAIIKYTDFFFFSPPVLYWMLALTHSHGHRLVYYHQLWGEFARHQTAVVVADSWRLEHIFFFSQHLDFWPESGFEIDPIDWSKRRLYQMIPSLK